jgi:hypothetical protein
LPDEEFKALTLTNYTLSLGKAWTDVDITYKGTFDGKLPDPVFSGGTATLTVQLERESSEESTLATALGQSFTAPTCELSYKSQYVSIRYVSRTKPIQARYPAELNGIKPTIQIVDQRGAKGTIAIVPLAQRRIGNVPVYIATDINGNPVTDALPPVLGVFNGISNIVNDGPTYTQEGQFYLCEEKNQVTVMPFSFASLLWSINLNQQPA